MGIRPISNIKTMHTPCAVERPPNAVHIGVCIPLHGCSDLDFLSAFEYEAEASVGSYAHLLHCAVPQRLIES